MLFEQIGEAPWLSSSPRALTNTSGAATPSDHMLRRIDREGLTIAPPSPYGAPRTRSVASPTATRT